MEGKIMGLGDKASRKLDMWRPSGITGKVVKAAAKGARGAHRAVNLQKDPFRDGRCHMSVAGSSKICNRKLGSDGYTCSRAACANLWLIAMEQGIDPRVQIVRW